MDRRSRHAQTPQGAPDVGRPSPRARRHRLFCLACALIMLACIAYAASYFAEESRVRREGETYRAMYSPRAA